MNFDYYGRKAAVVLPNKVSIFLISENNNKKVTDLNTGHEGPILNCSWAHPQYGTILATSGIDGKVILHKAKDENNLQYWDKLYTIDHKQTITCLSFNPYSCDSSLLELAVGYADGSLFYLTYFNKEWVLKQYKSHLFGVTGLAWLYPCKNKCSSLITCGNDYLMKLWDSDYKGRDLKEMQTLPKAHNSSIHTMELFSGEERGGDLLVSVDSDDEVYTWKMERNQDEVNFTPEQVKFASDDRPVGITHISWSKCGTFLSISTLDSMYLYKNYNNEWVLYSSLNNEGSITNYYDENN